MPLVSRRWSRVVVSMADRVIELIVVTDDRVDVSAVAVARPLAGDGAITLGGSLDVTVTVPVFVHQRVLTDDVSDLDAAPPLDVRFEGLPLRGVRGPRGALDGVHLHTMVTADVGWPVTHSLQVGPDVASGIYAVQFLGVDGAEVPFIVRPATRTADIVIVVPVLTYLAYANELLPRDLYPWRGDDRGHRFAGANRLAGLYDTAADGVGIHAVSFRRPLVTLRVDHHYPLSGGPHGLAVDVRLIALARRLGVAVDVICDLDVDANPDVLNGYSVALTGSHHEYWTAEMLDAVGRWVDAGGRLAHVGGNGAYWVTSLVDDVVEVRRGREGITTWSLADDELGLESSPLRGGRWRDNGRPEGALLATGLTGMGFDHSRAYRRTPQSHDAQWAWLFDGVADEFGTSGVVGGAAAGYEVDHADAAVGTPLDAVVLATAAGFSGDWVPESPGLAVHADLTWISRGRGEVLSVGSVAWLGSLADVHGVGGDVGVTALTSNLLTRWLSVPRQPL
jgi:N,N-dimethylformamidase